MHSLQFRSSFSLLPRFSWKTETCETAPLWNVLIPAPLGLQNFAIPDSFRDVWQNEVGCTYFIFTKGSMIPHVLHYTKGRLWMIKTCCAMQGKFNTDRAAWRQGTYSMGTPVKPGAFPFLESLLPRCSVLLLFHSLHSLSVQSGNPLWATQRYSHILPKCCFLAAACRPRGARLRSQRWSLFWSSLSYSCPIMALPRDLTIWSMMKCGGCWRSQKLWVTETHFEKFYS